MEAIIGFLSQGLGFIGPFFLLLGLLIFVHELGHFAVAKYYGVRVETFSLGFGRKIFKVKRGDTTYAISLIPLGGYVKMFGDDPTKEISAQEKEYSFLHKPVGQKIAIVLAGPLMNLFFAIFIFVVLLFNGVEVASPQLGDVSANSPAYASGLRSGDTILTVGSDKISSWDDFKNIVEKSANVALKLSVAREGTSETQSIEVTPKLLPNDDILSFKKTVGSIEGASAISNASLVGISSKESPAGIAGMHSLDVIEEINGEKINFYRQIAPALKRAATLPEFSIVVRSSLTKENVVKEGAASTKASKDERPPARTLTVKGWTTQETEDLAILKSFGVESTELYLMAIKEKSPALAAGLKPGDRVLEINGKAVNQWEEILETVKSYKKDSAPIAFKISREGESINFDIHPEMTQLMNRKLQEEERFTIGIIPAIAQAIADPIIRQTRNPIEAISYGVERSILLTKLTVIGIVKLVTNEVSPRNVAGVITIGRLANQSYEVGLNAFLKIMAVISINLFLLNLLPIPILDGGHLVFFTIEAIKGAPLSLRKMEIAQTVGFVLMMSLMAFALFNDIRNIFQSQW
jgi:regulator of sigma E protease